MYQLRDGRRADRTHIPRLVTDGVEQRFVLIKDLLFATHPDCQLAGCGSTWAAADRGVQHMNAPLGESSMDAAYNVRRIGRQVEIRSTGPHASEKTAFASCHLLHVGRSRKRGKHHVRRLCYLPDCVGPDRACSKMRRRRVAPQVVHHQTIASLLQAYGHLGTHRPEPDEAYLHIRLRIRAETGSPVSVLLLLFEDSLRNESRGH